jgi:hypothetical protein
MFIAVFLPFLSNGLQYVLQSLHFRIQFHLTVKLLFFPYFRLQVFNLFLIGYAVIILLFLCFFLPVTW